MRAYKPNPNGIGEMHNEGGILMDIGGERRIQVLKKGRPVRGIRPKVHVSLERRIKRLRAYNPGNVRRPIRKFYDVVET